MNPDCSILSYQFDAAVIHCPGREQAIAPVGARWVEIHTASGQYPALTWLPSPDWAERHVEIAKCHAVDLRLPDDTCVLLLTQTCPLANVAATDFVPRKACVHDGCVDAVRALIAGIDHPALRRFVEDAFLLREAFLWYWTSPASLRHHHAYNGGLVMHSVDVANRANLALADQPHQRDFAVAYALLHDFGKLWAYEDGHLSGEASQLGHEQIGFDRLMPAIWRLRESWPDGGLVMQRLLSGDWKRGNGSPALAVGSLVRSLDQYSAESDLRVSGASSRKDVVVFDAQD